MIKGKFETKIWPEYQWTFIVLFSYPFVLGYSYQWQKGTNLTKVLFSLPFYCPPGQETNGRLAARCSFYFAIWNKYLLLFWQIYFIFSTNIFYTLDKYILYFGQIYFIFWTNTFIFWTNACVLFVFLLFCQRQVVD